jgi:hypothetical protein
MDADLVIGEIFAAFVHNFSRASFLLRYRDDGRTRDGSCWKYRASC